MVKKKLKKILKAPKKGVGVKGISSKKVIKQLAEEHRTLVREAEEKPVEKDDRSLFFKRELEKERKWLS